MKWVYYLHQNGDLIGKNPIVVANDASYFDSPYVKKVWWIDTIKRETLWVLILEALALGARIGRVKELAEKNNCDRADSIKMLVRLKPNDLMRKGMTIFVQDILNEDVGKYWKEVWALGDGEE
jgi:hypothetical protein